jgi:hypothetical protein
MFWNLLYVVFAILISEHLAYADRVVVTGFNRESKVLYMQSPTVCRQFLTIPESVATILRVSRQLYWIEVNQLAVDTGVV